MRTPRTEDPGSGRAVTEPGGFDVAVAALTRALGDRLAPGVASFPDLFTEDGVIEVPFDGDGTADPIAGRAALEAMVASLDGVLRFDELTVTRVLDAGDGTVVCEYAAVLHRADLGSRFRRRYVAVMTLRGGRLAHVREYGGPFMPVGE
jgi:ketosteroid isomerase-like protein